MLSSLFDVFVFLGEFSLDAYSYVFEINELESRIIVESEKAKAFFVGSNISTSAVLQRK